MIDPRIAIPAMEKALSRRAFFSRTLKGIAVGAGAVAVLDRYPQLLAQTTSETQLFNTGLQIVSAWGDMIVPTDQDSGWSTFDPAITLFTLDVYIRQVFNLGVDIAYNGFLQAINMLNTIPPTIGYGPQFLSMDLPTRSQYLSDILVGNFENNGVQDILSYSAIFMMLGCKFVFFQNYPHHLANPTSEYQMVLGNTPNTAWDMIGFRGPVLAAEEAALRAAAAGAPALELPGVDWRNPFI